MLFVEKLRKAAQPRAHESALGGRCFLRCGCRKLPPAFKSRAQRPGKTGLFCGIFFGIQAIIQEFFSSFSPPTSL
jgi:hypothetical protein